MKKKAVIYINGIGGNVEEADRYKTVFPNYDIINLIIFPKLHGRTRKNLLSSLIIVAGAAQQSFLLTIVKPYFAMNALKNEQIEKAYFISPIMNMEHREAEQIDELTKHLSERQKKLIKLSQERKHYSKVADEIDELREKRHRIKIENPEKESTKRELEEIKGFLQDTETTIEIYDEELVRKYIKEIKKYDDRYIVEFN